jgi:hypothetical protein
LASARLVLLKKSGKIFFRVQIDKEIEFPEEYKAYTNGWYVEE